MASARIRLSLRGAAISEEWPEPRLVFPPIRVVIAGPPPGCGTGTISTPAALPSANKIMVWEVMEFPAATVNGLFSFLAQSIASFIVLKGELAGTRIYTGCIEMRATGIRSLKALYWTGASMWGETVSHPEP